MPDIPIDDILTAEQQADIRRELTGLAADPVVAFCRAALADYTDAVLLRRQESSVTTQHRLYRLVKDGCNGRVPSEAIVSRLFGMTERKAIAAIATISNRYRNDFITGWHEAARVAFAAREETDQAGLYRFTAPKVVIAYLNEVVSSLQSGRLPRIEAVKTTAGRYVIKQDTLNAICTELQIALPPLP